MKSLRATAVLLLAIAAVLVAGCQGNTADAPTDPQTIGTAPSADEVDLVNGEDLYANNCQSCHAADGTGTGMPNQPDLSDGAYWENTTRTDLIETVGDGKGAMPGLDSQLSEQQIIDVLAYAAGKADVNWSDIATSDAPALPGKQTGPEEPLMTIMVDLGRDMETINDALWRDDYETVATAAQSVADHPKVLASQRKTLRSALSTEDFRTFVAYDQAVHTHATNLSAAAEAGDTEAALEAYAELQRGCTGCHDDYRAPTRVALGGSRDTPDTLTVDPVDSNTSRPLRPIMVGLGEDMKAIGNGLWTGNMANVRQAARNVGHHPKIQQSDLDAVRSILGEERFRSFVAHDKAVHAGALNLSAAAERGDPRTITEEYVELQSGCQNCHTAFRDEIRSAN